MSNYYYSNKKKTSNTKKKTSDIRGFAPDAVKRKHIAPLTFVYGTDMPGVLARFSRFVNVLKENGEEPSVFNNVEEAIGYIQSGDIFSDSICVAIRNANDALKTSTESKRLYKEFTAALATYDDTSTFVICAEVPSGSMTIFNQFASFVSARSGIARDVSAPNENVTSKWIIEYAKTQGKTVDWNTAKMIDRACEHDVDKAASVIDYAYQELPNMTLVDLDEWLSNNRVIKSFEISKALVNNDIHALKEIYNRVFNASRSYHEFLNKIQYCANDYYVKATERGIDEDTRRWVLICRAIEEEKIRAVSSGSIPPSLDLLLAKISYANTQSKEK